MCVQHIVLPGSEGEISSRGGENKNTVIHLYCKGLFYLFHIQMMVLNYSKQYHLQCSEELWLPL